MAQIHGQTDNHSNGVSLIPSDCWGADEGVNAEGIRERILDIKKEIAPCKPRIIGVTKYYGLVSILRGYEAGLRDFGESRALEAIKKIEQLSKEVRNNSKFHFIGHLQTNKVDKVVEYFDYIHSVDSYKLAQVISKSSAKLNKRVKILLQVNNANEEQKFGYTKEALKSDFSQILKLGNIEIVGLMNIAPYGAEESMLRNLFKDIRNLKNELEQDYGIKLAELSMGMSDDYKIAVEEGATMIRIGRKLFTR